MGSPTTVLYERSNCLDSLGLDNPSGEHEAPDNDELARATETHLKSLEEFVELLNNALQSALEDKQVYNKVVSFATWWSNDLVDNDRTYLAQEAEALHELFDKNFHFKAKKLELTANKPKEAFRTAFWEAIKEAEPQKIEELNLFIFYYGGHGHAPDTWSGKQYFCSDYYAKHQISWDGHGQDLVEIDCDFIFIFDCCRAGAMINPQWKFRRRCEVLASCSPSVPTVGKKNHSFTNALVSVLKENSIEGHNDQPNDIVMIYQKLASSEVMENKGLQQDPQHYSYTRPTQSSILLHQVREMSAVNRKELQRPPSIRRLDTMSKARILLMVTFEDHNETPVVEAWVRALRNLPLKSIADLEALAVTKSNFLPKDKTELEALLISKLRLYSCFKTRSSTAIMSMPVWLWAYLQPHPAYKMITIVRSQDQLPDGFKELQNSLIAQPTQTIPVRAIPPASIHADDRILSQNTPLKDSAQQRRRPVLTGSIVQSRAQSRYGMIVRTPPDYSEIRKIMGSKPRRLSVK